MTLAMTNQTSLSERRILLIIGGGIAAYKTLDLIRNLKERGAQLRCILTAGGAAFVTPLSVASLSGAPVFEGLFSPKDESEIGHIKLSRESDLILVCPATANMIAKMASGLADDLATAVLLAADKQIYVIPSMNPQMWMHPATRRNLDQLESDGILIMPPAQGQMACGEEGPGRQPEPDDIIDFLEIHMPRDRILAGLHIVITAGPTREAIDPVRFISNHSSGKQGYAIAEACARAGAHVDLISGPVDLQPPSNVALTQVENAQQMLNAVEKKLPADVFIGVAAICDWRTSEIKEQKIKKQDDPSFRLDFEQTPDIVKTVSQKAQLRPRLVIGFAAETENIEENARAKRVAKGCDWILANNVSADSPVDGGVMGGNKNRILFIARDASAHWPVMSKASIATLLVEKIAHALKQDK